MSLNYDISAVKNWKRKLGSPNDRALFEALLLAFMFLGINQIVEEDIPEIEERLIRYQRIFGPLLYHKSKSGKLIPTSITPKELSRWIGMKTNISPMKNADFDRHIRSMARKHQKELQRRAKSCNT